MELHGLSNGIGNIRGNNVRHAENCNHPAWLCRPPLAVEFGDYRSVSGLDINPSRIVALCAVHDTTTAPPTRYPQGHLLYPRGRRRDPSSTCPNLITAGTCYTESIGVDLYYLTHKAETMCYHPQEILADPLINDGMGAYVASQLVELMLRRRIQVKGARVLILWLYCKENRPVLRNTLVVDCGVQVHAPWIDPTDAQKEYVALLSDPESAAYDATILAVAHDSDKDAGTAGIRANRPCVMRLEKCFWAQ